VRPTFQVFRANLKGRAADHGSEQKKGLDFFYRQKMEEIARQVLNLPGN